MFTKEQYVAYLISTPLRYSCKHLAEHLEQVSHDQITDFLEREHFTSRDLWQLVRPLIRNSSDAHMIVDDSVQDKRYSTKIEGVKLQYSGNEHGLVRGIGVVNLIHHSDGDDYYPIDYRVYDPEYAGKTKNDHFAAMIRDAIEVKKIAAKYILFDIWYGSVANLKLIHRLERYFVCPIKSNRLVSLSKETGYVHLETIDWTSEHLEHGVLVKLKELPFMVRLFKIVATDGDIAWVITNDLEGLTTVADTKAHTDVRWTIEQFHREVKQLTGTERCQCRKMQSQRNHLACCYHAWLSLKMKAKGAGISIYDVYMRLFSKYLRAELQNPQIPAFFPS